MTGQFWRLVVACVGIAAGGILTEVSRRQIVATEDPVWGAVMGGAIVLTSAALTFAAWGIRCPACKERWFWAAISKRGSQEWLQWLLGQPTCPNCQYSPVPHATSA